MPAKRILVIDDEVAILEVIQGCLEELSQIEVLTATSGIVGLQIARTEVLDGILLDVSMPEMDGLDVYQQLRSHHTTQSIPVVLLTAKVQPEDQAKFAQIGVTTVIMKPFDPIALVDQVTAAFGWHT